MVVETHWSDIWLSAADWAQAFEAPDPGTPHNVPSSIRNTGHPVEHGSTSDVCLILDAWLASQTDGVACVVSTDEIEGRVLQEPSRVRSLTPRLSKGLEFDLVVLIDPETFGEGIEGAVDRYVTTTRATRRLVILSGFGVASASLPPSWPSGLTREE